MVTIKDVAEKAGVSKATVSRIINGQGSFRKETIEQVRRAMEELHYHPDPAAGTPDTRRPKMLALVMPNKELPVFGLYTAALEYAAYQEGYRLMLCSSFYNREEELKSIQLLKSNLVDGILYGGFSEDISHFSQIDLPVVSIGRKLSDTIPVVRADNRMAGKLACRHMLSRGSRRLLYITGFPGGLHRDEKYRGIQEILENEIAECFPYQVTMEMQVDNTIDLAVNHAILDHPNVDGIIAETDIIAMKCLQACASIGYRVPEQLKIIGYGDYFFTKLSNPPLTTIVEPIEYICRAAVKKLVRMIETGGPRGADEELPVSLIERKTT